VTSILPHAADKPGYVAAMFGRIAPRYDVMNTLITLGQDARWRRRVAESLDRLPAGSSVLDVGGGTGRLGSAIAERHPNLRVSTVDFSQPMLRLAPPHLRRTAGDALRLPFGDGTFAAVVSGFVIRNVADVHQALDEQLRVLRPGGLLAILETTPGPGGILQPLYRLYFRRLVPPLGKLIAGDASAYTYLPVSTLAFLEPTRLAAALRDKGLVNVRTTPLMLRSVAINVGTKPTI
jgi:demethylmenaquinone methyltransferase / 2-methoxy-6-polyprenyl-1,4-benzoquinol methylase